MASQKNILNFFKPLSVKRPLSTVINDLDPPTKKIKDENNGKETDAPSPVNLSSSTAGGTNKNSPYFQKYLQAKIKLISRRYPALHPNIGETWFDALAPEFGKPYFLKIYFYIQEFQSSITETSKLRFLIHLFPQLSQFLTAERQSHTIFPPEEEVWTWTHKCSVNEVKVVILGQDPYHNPRLCFSVQKGVPPPPSLLNMYKELQRDIPGFVAPKHGNLTGWAKQGVLLLNACLTVRAHNANSHKDKGWEQLTDAVVKYISDNNRGVVFLLWGSYAQKKAAAVDKKKHHLLMSTHPSPLSAHRGFLGCGHFSRCNELLKNQNKKAIDWGDLHEE
ncbi:Uracil-DNA glycosylase [Blattella germanica]|nr:Uracil-DNA glycosylase [Blattella germanica]